MTDIEPPSFSLGIDLDFEPSNIQPSVSQACKNIEETEKGKAKEDDDEFNLWVSDSEPDSPEKPRLTRLRRGGPSSSKAISTPIINSADDDIEEFSDEDNVNKNDNLAHHQYALCSSSKLPLSGCGVLKSKPESAIHSLKGKQVSSCPPTCLASNKGKTVFSDFTASPLRSFQLLDSDSDRDNPSNGVHNYSKAHGVSLKSNKQKEPEILARFKLLDSESSSDDQSNSVRLGRKASCVRNDEQKEAEIQARSNLINSESAPDNTSNVLHVDRENISVEFSITHKQKRFNNRGPEVNLGKSKDVLPDISQNKDPWQDFCVREDCSVKTPAFDEFCEEYFKTVKSSKPAPDPHKVCSSEKEKRLNSGTKLLQPQDSESVVPPCQCYFFHDDLRIQALVRSRLPYFFPLSTPGDAGVNSRNATSIDYMSQFGQDGAKRQTGKQVTAEKSSRSRRKKTKNSNIDATSLGSGDWINPKQTVSTPKDAGRRRVHADGQSAGYWCTTENGMKVYVTKDGKELTGQLAYRHYRKESGKGFKKSRRKKGGAKKT